MPSSAPCWRGTSNVTWRTGAWTTHLGASYVGPSQDSGATTTAALYDSLGQPASIATHFTGGAFVYRYITESTLTYHLSVGYRFGRTPGPWLRDTRVRVGLVNLTDQAPPISSGGFGYSPGVSQNLLSGRTWSLELTKAF